MCNMYNRVIINFNFNSLICNSCVKGYYLSENSCYRCVDSITNCDVCDSSTKCT